MLVDYAHTPDALDVAFARGARPRGRGRASPRGVRVRRRPRPREAAVDGRDRGRSGPTVAIVTSDNPRSEDPAAIVDDILAGMPERTARSSACSTGATRSAGRVAAARPGDVVVVAGKGHETGQIIGGRTEPVRRPGRGPRRAGGTAREHHCRRDRTSRRRGRRRWATPDAVVSSWAFDSRVLRAGRVLRRAARRARRPRLRRRTRSHAGASVALVDARAGGHRSARGCRGRRGRRRARTAPGPRSPRRGGAPEPARGRA